MVAIANEKQRSRPTATNCEELLFSWAQYWLTFLVRLTCKPRTTCQEQEDVRRPPRHSLPTWRLGEEHKLQSNDLQRRTAKTELFLGCQDWDSLSSPPSQASPKAFWGSLGGLSWGAEPSLTHWLALRDWNLEQLRGVGVVWGVRSPNSLAPSHETIPVNPGNCQPPFSTPQTLFSKMVLGERCKV